jgi:hypothetical protein
MSLIRLGFGATAALVLTLGLGSAPAPQGGSYVTLGQGQTASKVAMLGLSPGAPAQGGSYITLGQGQTASKFAMLGLTPAEDEVEPPSPPRIDAINGPPRRIRIDLSGRQRPIRDDQEVIELLLSLAASGALNGKG